LRAPEYTSDAIVRERHKRAVLTRIIAPVAAAAVLLVVVAAIIALAMSTRQISVVASFMSLLILVPMVLVCLIPYVLIVAMFAGTRKLYFKLPGVLSTARSAAHRVNLTAHRLSMGVARPIIAINQRAAWLEQVAGRKPRKPFLPTERR
jgi:hypothetical protein